MTTKEIVAVIGATGGQGGSVVDALITKPEYHIRAITRNVESAKAQSLRERGAEVVCADVNDEASLVEAFQVSESGI